MVAWGVSPRGKWGADEVHARALSARTAVAGNRGQSHVTARAAKPGSRSGREVTGVTPATVSWPGCCR
jgi:hypothetical protein